MTHDEQETYEEGRAAAQRYGELYPDQVAHLSRGNPDPSPELGRTLRNGMDAAERAHRLEQRGSDSTLSPENSANPAALKARYERYKAHIATLPAGTDPEKDPQAMALFSAIEAAGDAAHAHALAVGVPGDDLCSDAPQPEDALYARGFLDELRLTGKPKT